MAGRPRKPTHLKLVTGTARTARLNHREPKVQPGAPEAPRHLTARARAFWPKVAKSLASMGVMADVDQHALESLCECYAQVQEARASFKKPLTIQRLNKTTGELVDEVIAKAGAQTYVSYGKDGYMIRTRPELALIAAADARFVTLLQQFGLTPASRSKVNVIPQQDADPAAEFFA